MTQRRRIHMKKSKVALSAISIALLSLHAIADTDAERIERLEKRMDQLEQKSEDVNGAANVTADGADNATYDDISGLQQTIENYKWEQQRLRELSTATSTRSLAIFGTVQTRASWSEKAVTNDNNYKLDNSFDTGAVLIGFKGNLYKDYEFGKNLNYRLSFGASPQANAPDLSVLDAIISYDLLPTLDQETGRLQVTLGQRIIPFGLEVSASEELKPVINNAQFASRLGLSERQTGLYVTGDIAPFVDYGFNYRAPLFSWDFGIVNGTGTNKSDNNGKKDLVGRVQAIVPVDNYTSLLREIKIGVSGYKGYRNLDLGDGQVPFGTGNFSRVGVDVSYNHNPIGLTYEYIRGKDEVIDVPNTKTTGTIQSESNLVTLFLNYGDQFVKSFSGQAKYDDWWPKTYQPFIRWDGFDPNKNVSNDEKTIITLGFNLFFAQTTKLQINLNRVHDDLLADSSYQALTQIQFGF